MIDHTWYGVNNETAKFRAPEVMQFGGALPRLLWRIRHADPKHGPVYMAKFDVNNGFYNIQLHPRHALRLAVILPSYDDLPPLVAIPLSMTMGWERSPPTFSTASETGADISNANMQDLERQAPHRLEDLAAIKDQATPPTTPTSTREAPRAQPAPLPGRPRMLPPPLPALPTALPTQRPLAKPLAYTDVFVDDFLALVQGNAHRRRQARRALLHAVDQVFAEPETPDRPQPISEKKLRRGDGSWDTVKTLLGWVVDSVKQTISMPDHRQQAVKEWFDEMRGRKRDGARKWQRMIGLLRFVSPAIRGSKGLFSALQLGLKHSDRNRIRITRHIADHLAKFEELLQDVGSRPTRLAEIVPDHPTIIGACDAAKPGMGGVLFHPKQPPTVWRARFPASVQRNLVSDDNPHGEITNSDLEQAGVLAHADVANCLYDLRESTVATLCDNTPTVSRNTKGAVTSDQAGAYLC